MNVTRNFATSSGMLIACFLACGGMFGCQTNIGGQTLPSPYYLRDDVQFFPAGPEFLLPETVRAHQEYKTAQEAEAEGIQAVP